MKLFIVTLFRRPIYSRAAAAARLREEITTHAARSNEKHVVFGVVVVAANVAANVAVVDDGGNADDALNYGSGIGSSGNSKTTKTTTKQY